MTNLSSNFYHDAIQNVCNGAQMIVNSSSISETYKKVFIDLLYRIKRNCLSLKKISDRESDYLIIRLIQRTLIEDLITFFFFASLVDNDTNFNNALAVMNKKSIDSIKEWLEVHWTIDVINAEKDGKKQMTRDEYFEFYNSYVQQNYSCASDKKCKINEVNFCGNPKDMLFCTKDPNLRKAINYL